MDKLVDKILTEVRTPTVVDDDDDKPRFPQLPKPILKAIVKYVENHDVASLNQIAKFPFPPEFKYTGEVYRVIGCSKEQVQQLLKGKGFRTKANVVSYSQSMRGMTHTYHNLVNDYGDKFNNAVILKGLLSKSNCIVDITHEAFDDLPWHDEGYTNYADEEEVIGKNIFKLVSLKNLDGYVINGNAKGYNGKRNK